MSKDISLDKIPNEYVPDIYNISNIPKDILKSKVDPKFSTSITYPKFSLGFHHYIHQSKDKMEVTSQFKGKKKVYYIMNNFERNIDDYDSDIDSVSKVYFDIDPKPNILSRAFYKLWEILFMFDLVQTDKSDFISAHLAEGPGSFIQATMFFRDKFTKKGLSKNDKYYAVTLHKEQNENIPPLEESFIKYYDKEKPKRFIQHTTYPKKTSKTSSKQDNGDLTDLKTIELFSNNFKDKKRSTTRDGY